MKDCTVYFSIPVSVDWNTALKHMAVLKDKCKITYWERGTKYDESLLLNADLIVVLLPNNKFSIEFDELPIGVRTELNSHNLMGKSTYNVFIGYQNTQKNYNIYNSTFEDLDEDNEDDTLCGTFKGISGTSSTIFEIINEFDDVETTILYESPIFSQGTEKTYVNPVSSCSRTNNILLLV